MNINGINIEEKTSGVTNILCGSADKISIAEALLNKHRYNWKNMGKVNAILDGDQDFNGYVKATLLVVTGKLSHEYIEDLSAILTK